jgi:uncharacterized protein (TIGR00369 family)
MINPDKILLDSHRPGDVLPFESDAQPFARALGAQLTAVDAVNGVVQLRFTPGREFIQGMGVVQGGAVSAMLDFAMGFAGLAMMEEGFFITTATLNIAFLRAAPAGNYTATGLVERRGKTLIFTRGELRAQAGTLVATGTGSLAVVTPKP